MIDRTPSPDDDEVVVMPFLRGEGLPGAPYLRGPPSLSEYGIDETPAPIDFVPSGKGAAIEALLIRVEELEVAVSQIHAEQAEVAEAFAADISNLAEATKDNAEAGKLLLSMAKDQAAKCRRSSMFGLPGGKGGG